MDEIERLSLKKIIILVGEKVLSQTIEDELISAGFKSTRIKVKYQSSHTMKPKAA